jgi:hypothetical protein
MSPIEERACRNRERGRQLLSTRVMVYFLPVLWLFRGGTAGRPAP